MHDVLAIVLGVLGVLAVLWLMSNRRRAQRPIEAEAQDTQTDPALTPALWWAQGIHDVLKASGVSPQTFELSDGNLLILTSRGNWKLHMQEQRVEFLAPNSNTPARRPNNEPPEGY